MPKSPLIKILRQAYRVARFSRKSGIPTPEILDILAEKISRRHLLKIGLGLTTAIAASNLTGNNRPVTAQRGISPILVVGMGIAGLTAAYRLKQAGVPVDAIEARNRVGGRMRTLPKIPGTNLVAELGGEFINTDHTFLRSLAKELGFQEVDLHEAQKGLIEEIFFFQEQKVNMERIIEEFAPIAQQMSSDLKAIENFASYQTSIPAADELDRLSITEYLQRAKATPLIQKIIEVAYNVEYGLEPQEQSCLNLLYLIGTKPGEFSILGSSDERFYIDGGNDRIPRRLGQLLGDSLQTSMVLESIASLSDGRYRVALRSGGTTKERKYERILLALPFSILRNINLKVDLPPVKRLAIDTLGYGTNSKLITSYQKKIWQTSYKSSGTVYADLGFQNTWETSHSTYSPSVEGSITNYTGGRQGLNIGTRSLDYQAQKFIPQLEKVFPGISKARLRRGKPIRAYWTGEEYSRGSYSCYKVGQWTQMYGSEGERVGNLFFAGEHTSLENQGYMEGGCETGEAAAVAILKDLGLSESTNREKLFVKKTVATQ